MAETALAGQPASGALSLLGTGESGRSASYWARVISVAEIANGQSMVAFQGDSSDASRLGSPAAEPSTTSPGGSMTIIVMRLLVTNQRKPGRRPSAANRPSASSTRCAWPVARSAHSAALWTPPLGSSVNARTSASSTSAAGAEALLATTARPAPKAIACRIPGSGSLASRVRQSSGRSVTRKCCNRYVRSRGSAR